MSKRDSKNDFPEKKVRWYHKLGDKYRLIILDEDTFEEKLSFRLSRMNVFVLSGMLAIILIFLTTYLIAFTPLREYIPGYKDTNITGDLYELQIKADSLEKAFASNELYIANMKKILSGQDDNMPPPQVDTSHQFKYNNITIKKSKEDSLLRREYERSTKYELATGTPGDARNSTKAIITNFFAPIKGVITGKYDLKENHYGVDIVAKKNEAVKAVYDGTVIFSEWSSSTGHVIALQHVNNVISIYKHNSLVLRKQGAHVKAGESIAIIGESGEYTTGPHLHFELWINAKPVNPENYVIF